MTMQIFLIVSPGGPLLIKYTGFCGGCALQVFCVVTHISKWVVPSKGIKYTKATVTQSHFEKTLLVSKQGFSVSWSVCKWISIISVLCIPVFAPARERCSEPAGDGTGVTGVAPSVPWSSVLHFFMHLKICQDFCKLRRTHWAAAAVCTIEFQLPEVFKAEEPPKNQHRQLPLTHHLEGKGFPL